MGLGDGTPVVVRLVLDRDGSVTTVLRGLPGDIQRALGPVSSSLATFNRGVSQQFKSLAQGPSFRWASFVTGINQVRDFVRSTLGDVGRTTLFFASTIGAAFRAVSNAVIKPTDNFRKFQITLEGALGSAKRARDLTVFAQQLARTSPFRLEEIQEVIQALTLLPATARTLSGPISQVRTQIEGLTRTIQGLALLNPEGITGALRVFREAVGGNLRSLEFRLDVPAEAVAASINTTVEELRKGGPLVIKALTAYVDQVIGSDAIKKLASVFSVQFGNIKDALLIFGREIGEAGFFDRLTEKTKSLSDALGFFADSIDGSDSPFVKFGFAARASDALTAALNGVLNIFKVAGTLLPSLGSAFSRIEQDFADLPASIRPIAQIFGSLISVLEVVSDKFFKFTEGLTLDPGKVTRVFKDIFGVIDRVVTAIGRLIDVVRAIGPELIKGLQFFAVTAGLNFLYKQVAGLGNLIKTFGGDIKNFGKNAESLLANLAAIGRTKSLPLFQSFTRDASGKSVPGRFGIGGIGSVGSAGFPGALKNASDANTTTFADVTGRSLKDIILGVFKPMATDVSRAVGGFFRELPGKINTSLGALFKDIPASKFRLPDQALKFRSITAGADTSKLPVTYQRSFLDFNLSPVKPTFTQGLREAIRNLNARLGEYFFANQTAVERVSDLLSREQLLQLSQKARIGVAGLKTGRQRNVTLTEGLDPTLGRVLGFEGTASKTLKTADLTTFLGPVRKLRELFTAEIGSLAKTTATKFSSVFKGVNFFGGIDLKSQITSFAGNVSQATSTAFKGVNFFNGVNLFEGVQFLESAKTLVANFASALTGLFRGVNIFRGVNLFGGIPVYESSKRLAASIAQNLSDTLRTSNFLKGVNFFDGVGLKQGVASLAKSVSGALKGANLFKGVNLFEGLIETAPSTARTLGQILKTNLGLDGIGSAVSGTFRAAGEQALKTFKEVGTSISKFFTGTVGPALVQIGEFFAKSLGFATGAISSLITGSFNTLKQSSIVRSVGGFLGRAFAIAFDDQFLSTLTVLFSRAFSSLGAILRTVGPILGNLFLAEFFFPGFFDFIIRRFQEVFRYVETEAAKNSRLAAVAIKKELATGLSEVTFINEAIRGIFESGELVASASANARKIAKVFSDELAIGLSQIRTKNPLANITKSEQQELEELRRRAALSISSFSTETGRGVVPADPTNPAFAVNFPDVAAFQLKKERLESLSTSRGKIDLGELFLDTANQKTDIDNALRDFQDAAVPAIKGVIGNIRTRLQFDRGQKAVEFDVRSVIGDIDTTAIEKQIVNEIDAMYARVRNTNRTPLIDIEKELADVTVPASIQDRASQLTRDYQKLSQSIESSFASLAKNIDEKAQDPVESLREVRDQFTSIPDAINQLQQTASPVLGQLSQEIAKFRSEINTVDPLAAIDTSAIRLLADTTVSFDTLVDSASNIRKFASGADVDLFKLATGIDEIADSMKDLAEIDLTNFYRQLDLKKPLSALLLPNKDLDTLPEDVKGQIATVVNRIASTRINKLSTPDRLTEVAKSLADDGSLDKLFDTALPRAERVNKILAAISSIAQGIDPINLVSTQNLEVLDRFKIKVLSLLKGQQVNLTINEQVFGQIRKLIDTAKKQVRATVQEGLEQIGKSQFPSERINLAEQILGDTKESVGDRLIDAIATPLGTLAAQISPEARGVGETLGAAIAYGLAAKFELVPALKLNIDRSLKFLLVEGKLQGALAKEFIEKLGIAFQDELLRQKGTSKVGIEELLADPSVSARKKNELQRLQVDTQIGGIERVRSEFAEDAKGLGTENAKKLSEAFDLVLGSIRASSRALSDLDFALQELGAPEKFRAADFDSILRSIRDVRKEFNAYSVSAHSDVVVASARAIEEVRGLDEALRSLASIEDDALRSESFAKFAGVETKASLLTRLTDQVGKNRAALANDPTLDIFATYKQTIGDFADAAVKAGVPVERFFGVLKDGVGAIDLSADEIDRLKTLYLEFGLGITTFSGSLDNGIDNLDSFYSVLAEGSRSDAVNVIRGSLEDFAGAAREAGLTGEQAFTSFIDRVRSSAPELAKSLEPYQEVLERLFGSGSTLTERDRFRQEFAERARQFRKGEVDAYDFSRSSSLDSLVQATRAGSSSKDISTTIGSYFESIDFERAFARAGDALADNVQSSLTGGVADGLYDGVTAGKADDAIQSLGESLNRAVFSAVAEGLVDGLGISSGVKGVLSGIASIFSSGIDPSTGAAPGLHGPLQFDGSYARGGILHGGFLPFRRLAGGGLLKSPTFGLLGEGTVDELAAPLTPRGELQLTHSGGRPVYRTPSGEEVPVRFDRQQPRPDRTVSGDGASSSGGGGGRSASINQSLTIMNLMPSPGQIVRAGLRENMDLIVNDFSRMSRNPGSAVAAVFRKRRR